MAARVLLLLLLASVEGRKRYPWFKTPKAHLFPMRKRPLGTRIAAKALALHVVFATALARPRMVEILTCSNVAVHLCWYAAPLSDRTDRVLDTYFIARSSLRKYDERPLTMVLPCFSHRSREHLAANLGFLQFTVPFLLQQLPRRRVAHLYSAACIGSSLAECFVPTVLRRFRVLRGSVFATHEVRQGLGASGALTALAVYACLSYPRASLETSIPFFDPRVRAYPLWACCLAMVAADVYGLTRQQGEVREGDVEGAPMVGHDAHIAGAAVGAAAWLALVAPGRCVSALFRGGVRPAPRRLPAARRRGGYERRRRPFAAAAHVAQRNIAAPRVAARRVASVIKPEIAACVAFVLWLLSAYARTCRR